MWCELAFLLICFSTSRMNVEMLADILMLRFEDMKDVQMNGV